MGKRTNGWGKINERQHLEDSGPIAKAREVVRLSKQPCEIMSSLLPNCQGHIKKRLWSVKFRLHLAHTIYDLFNFQ